jgi:hypothetical protein
MSRYDKKNSPVPALIVVTSLVVMVLGIGYAIIAGIQFDRKYEGHLKRAADANSLKLAEKELTTAYAYLKQHRLDTEAGRNAGWLDDNTNILYTTPDNQISFHVDNVKASLDDVSSVKAMGDKASALERSNVLIKLRESLLDDRSDGHHVTCPTGLSVFPYNMELTLAFWGSVLGLLIGGIWLKVRD